MLLDKLHLLAGCFVLAIFIASTSAQDAEVEQIAPYQGERNNVFDWDLFKKLLKSNEGNVLLSPTSLRFVLALIYVGARRNSALELQKVIHLPASRPAMRLQYSNLIKSLQKHSPEYELNIGTKIFLQNGVSLRPKYKEIINQHYQSDVSMIDFKNFVTAAEAINEYVKELTKGRVDKIVEDASTLQDNLMVLVNALYFKGKWTQKFEEDRTKDDEFHTSDGKTVKVPFMKTTGDFNLVYDKDDLNAQILRLPYAGNKYSMYIVLPASDVKLDNLVEKINPQVISKNMKNMYEMEAAIEIPKFKFDFTINGLKDNLIEMGIKDIFGDSANLSGILAKGSQNLYVTDIVQKAGIEVSEEGTTAYAATEAGISIKVLPYREYFSANRPFLFYIEDDTNGEVLFMGRVNNPLEGSN